MSNERGRNRQRNAGRKTERATDRQRHKDKQKDRDIKTERQIGGYKHEQTDRQKLYKQKQTSVSPQLIIDEIVQLSGIEIGTAILSS